MRSRYTKPSIVPCALTSLNIPRDLAAATFSVTTAFLNGFGQMLVPRTFKPNVLFVMLKSTSANTQTSSWAKTSSTILKYFVAKKRLAASGKAQ